MDENGKNRLESELISSNGAVVACLILRTQPLKYPRCIDGLVPFVTLHGVPPQGSRGSRRRDRPWSWMIVVCWMQVGAACHPVSVGCTARHVTSLFLQFH
jgi:hypothetical protein